SQPCQLLPNSQVCHRHINLIAIVQQRWHEKLAIALSRKYHDPPSTSQTRSQLSPDLFCPSTALSHASAIEGLFIRGDAGIWCDYAVKGGQDEPVSLFGLDQGT